MQAELKIVRRAFQAKRLPSESELAAWEAASGWRLPEDYRRFLLRWNGGTIRPFGFQHEHPQREPGEWTVLEFLLDWDAVLARSQFDIDEELRTTPAGHLVIGICLLDIAIVMSLKEDSHGSIRTWLKELNENWGSPGNDQLGEVAPSFTAFLEKLATSDDKHLYHGFWCRPETAPKSWEILQP